MRKAVKIFVLVLGLSLIVLAFSACSTLKSDGQDYTIPTLDLSVKPSGLDAQYNYLYDLVTLDNSKDYLGHPDSVLLKNGNILTLYPIGHGKGAIVNKVSTDGGLTYSSSIENTPQSWENSLETPTIYRLKFYQRDIPDKLIIISGNPKWPSTPTNGGFNSSVSTNEGQTWTEFETFYSKDDKTTVIPIVSMASLTQLKENGMFVDKWMAFFHDASFNNYKTILTFDTDEKPQWSEPEKYFEAYKDMEKDSNMCEVEVIRSDKGSGNELCLITRSNSKKINSLVSFSIDEGKTWSQPKELPAALNGERHKAEYADDGRLFITFRSIERGPKALANPEKGHEKRGWMSEGWVAWVGTYDDLKNATQGQYRIKLAHTYLVGQTAPEYSANGDTGYCGNVVLADGTIVTSTYGRFSPTDMIDGGKDLRTYIASKRISLKDTDKLVKLYGQ